MKQIELETMNYIGPSMYPILKPGDRLEVVPYNMQNIRRGDVIFFISPADQSKVVHRVVYVDSNGIRARGDNCKRIDPWVLSPDQIVGRVISVHRGRKRRRIFGGPLGQMIADVLSVMRAVDATVSFLLRPGYHRLARAGIFKRWLPKQIEIRVISVNQPEGTELHLRLGRRVIGRWLPGHNGWQIRRPFRLFVDEAALPENKAEVSGVPPTLC